MKFGAIIINRYVYVCVRACVCVCVCVCLRVFLCLCKCILFILFARLFLRFCAFVSEYSLTSSVTFLRLISFLNDLSCSFGKKVCCLYKSDCGRKIVNLIVVVELLDSKSGDKTSRLLEPLKCFGFKLN